MHPDSKNYSISVHDFKALIFNIFFQTRLFAPMGAPWSCDRTPYFGEKNDFLD